MLGAAVVLVAIVGGLAGYVGSRIDVARAGVGAPPFYGFWRAAMHRSVLGPVAVAVAVLWVARHRYDVRWRWVLLGAVIAALMWSATLGYADSAARLTYQIHGPADYARGLGPIGSHPGHYLATFNVQARGPGGEVIARGYPVHVQGHPPGAVLTLWALTRIGFTATGGGVALVWSGLVATIVGVLLSVRRVAGEAAARAAAPFVVLVPAAVWSHTYDSYFAGIGALAVMSTVFALVPATHLRGTFEASHQRSGLRVSTLPGGVTASRIDRRTVCWAVLGGVLFGYLALLSYGLVLLAIGPALIAVRERRSGPLFITGAAAAATIAIPFAWGFNWFGGLATTHHQYVHSVASARPYGYFVWGNLVIAVVALGPAVVAGFIIAVRRRSTPIHRRWRGAAPLVLGALGALLVADVTGLAKAEVERIFQPFFPWLAVAGVAIAAPIVAVRRDRLEPVALALQALIAITLATQLSSPW